MATTLPNFAQSQYDPLSRNYNILSPTKAGGSFGGIVGGYGVGGTMPGSTPFGVSAYNANLSFPTYPAPNQNLAGNIDDSGYTAAYGGKPLVPNPNATAAGAIQGNLANMPAIAGLAEDINAINLGGVMNDVTTNIPNYYDLIGQRSDVLNSWLAGDLAPGTKDMIREAGAEFGIGSGMGPGAGPSLANMATVRSMGMTAEDQAAKGLSGLQASISGRPQAPLYDPGQMLTSPSEAQTAQWLANLLKAAPDPTAAAQAAWSKYLEMFQLGQIAQANQLANMLRQRGIQPPAGMNINRAPMPNQGSVTFPNYGGGFLTPGTTSTVFGGETGPLAYAPTYDPSQNPTYDPFAVENYTAPSIWGPETGLSQYAPYSWGEGMMPGYDPVADVSFDPNSYFVGGY